MVQGTVLGQGFMANPNPTIFFGTYNFINFDFNSLGLTVRNYRSAVGIEYR